MDKNLKIYLSPPTIDSEEFDSVQDALSSGWISPFGSYIENFTQKLYSFFNKDVLLTNSGTSSIHLALKLANIKEGDYVLASNFTFAATAFPILYEKAIPVFIGSENLTWNLSPEYLLIAIEQLKKQNIKPKALILAHIYGASAQLDLIIDICNAHNIILIEDSAEALGSKYNNIALGSFGEYGIISFNGNKIITCSTGGALILPDKDKFKYAKKLASQAKEDAEYYLHHEIGYNYVQSNILAAIGCSQFNKLNLKITKRREIFSYYYSYLKEKIEIEYQQEYKNSFSNRWLSSFIFPSDFNKKIKYSLAKNNIESRFLWNPLHNQKVFKKFPFFGDKELDDNLFKNGLSLPSGDNLTPNYLEKIISIINKNIK